ncbi:hypothetical protein V8E36_007722 [Tilletia maclaganii]
MLVSFLHFLFSHHARAAGCLNFNLSRSAKFRARLWGRIPATQSITRMEAQRRQRAASSILRSRGQFIAAFQIPGFPGLLWGADRAGDDEWWEDQRLKIYKAGEQKQERAGES